MVAVGGLAACAGAVVAGFIVVLAGVRSGDGRVGGVAGGDGVAVGCALVIVARSGCVAVPAVAVLRVPGGGGGRAAGLLPGPAAGAVGGDRGGAGERGDLGGVACAVRVVRRLLREHHVPSGTVVVVAHDRLPHAADRACV